MRRHPIISTPDIQSAELLLAALDAEFPHYHFHAAPDGAIWCRFGSADTSAASGQPTIRDIQMFARGFVAALARGAQNELTD